MEKYGQQMLQIKSYSRKEFSLLFNDETILNYLNDYFICINATGWIHSNPVFKKFYTNVLNLYFDDIEKTGLKLVPWFNNTQNLIYATACSDEQARLIKEFIRKIPDNSNLHIYCTKGRSRSPAIEKFAREYKNNELENDIKNYNNHVYKILKECDI